MKNFVVSIRKAKTLNLFNGYGCKLRLPVNLDVYHQLIFGIAGGGMSVLSPVLLQPEIVDAQNNRFHCIIDKGSSLESPLDAPELDAPEKLSGDKK